MTIHEVASQIYHLTLGGFVNGEKFTKRELERVLRIWLKDAQNNTIPNTVVVELCLPDGRWLSTVTKFADRPDGFDYWIPDTRDQEFRLMEQLGIA